MMLSPRGSHGYSSANLGSRSYSHRSLDLSDLTAGRCSRASLRNPIGTDRQAQRRSLGLVRLPSPPSCTGSRGEDTKKQSAGDHP